MALWTLSLCACVFTCDCRLKQAQSCWLMVWRSGNNKHAGIRRTKTNSYRSRTLSCCRRPPPSNTVPVRWRHRRTPRGEPSQLRGQRSPLSLQHLLHGEGTLLCRWRWGGSWRDGGTEEQKKGPGQNSVLRWIDTRNNQKLQWAFFLTERNYHYITDRRHESAVVLVFIVRDFSFVSTSVI